MTLKGGSPMSIGARCGSGRGSARAARPDRVRDGLSGAAVAEWWSRRRRPSWCTERTTREPVAHVPVARFDQHNKFVWSSVDGHEQPSPLPFAAR
jgi:uncharacterized protein YfaQ (DUF2300 family)